MEQVHFTPKACLCSGSLLNFLREFLWLWPGVTVTVNCYVHAEVGEGNRGWVGRRIRCPTADLQVLLRCMPYFTLLPFLLSITELGFVWGPAGELDFTFTNFFLFLAEASHSPLVFDILEIYQHILSADDSYPFPPKWLWVSLFCASLVSFCTIFYFLGVIPVMLRKIIK